MLEQERTVAGITIESKEDGVTIVTIEDTLGTFVAGETVPWVLGNTLNGSHLEKLVSVTPADDIVCIDFDQVMAQPEMAMQCLPAFAAVVAAFADSDYVVAVLDPSINFGTFVVVSTGTDVECAVGDRIVPEKYKNQVNDRR